MSNAADRDLPLKLRFRRLLFSQGYWCPLEVELSQYESQGSDVKRRALTDLDVLGIRYDRFFTPQRVVGDCKTGKNVSDANRLFWLRGVMDYFGAEEGYFLRPRIASHARAIAPKMGLRVLDEASLTALEKATGADGVSIPLADATLHQDVMDLWGIDVPKKDELSPKERALKKTYSYLSYSYWYIEAHRNLLTLIGHFEGLAETLAAGDPRHVLLAYTGAGRLAHCLLALADYVQARGAEDVPRYARIYLYGGPLAMKDKERFFALMHKATGVTEPLDPPWLNDVLELLGRIMRNPVGGCDILRHLEAAYLMCAHLGGSVLPELGPEGDNTAALVLARDVAQTFTKAAGLSRDLFGHMASL